MKIPQILTLIRFVFILFLELNYQSFCKTTEKIVISTTDCRISVRYRHKKRSNALLQPLLTLNLIL